MKNIFGDFVTNLAFPYASLGQGKMPTNKQLIDAAVLRGSLELLKPKQKGENFASQVSRALDAGIEPAKNLAEYQLSAAKSRQSGALGESSIITNIKDDVDKALLKVGDISGIKDISKQYPVLYNNIVTNAIRVFNSPDSQGYLSANEYTTRIFNELYGNVKKDDATGKLTIINKETASPGLIDLIDKANTAIPDLKPGEGNIRKRNLKSDE
jgi:hypothetical protein|tara:strand:+ start:544 stop:1179 length:636 start_codon:yes stop_codon:yes gene_type:complete